LLVGGCRHAAHLAEASLAALGNAERPEIFSQREREIGSESWGFTTLAASSGDLKGALKDIEAKTPTAANQLDRTT